MLFIENTKYDLVAPTSMGVRITPFDRQPVQTSSLYNIQVTSAESNVLSAPASLGLKTKVLTTFVKDSPIAAMIKKNLKSRHIDYEGIDVEQGGPWGYRHQINIADSGYGVRAPRVHNDRAGEVGRTLNVKDFDLDKIFQQEGAKLLHVSGLIAALSKETGQFCLDLARTAKKHGTKISFDLNYRASFWRNRENELSQIFKEIASLSNILIGNEEDFQLALGFEGPKAGGEGLDEKIESFKKMIKKIESAYPETELFATTLREVENANLHHWGAIMFDKTNWHIVRPRPIVVLDRIGGGDGFVAGLLYGLLKGKSAEESFHFGWANGAYTTTILEDYSQPMTEEHIWSVWEGNARVRR